jgi:hypothetical protein
MNILGVSNREVLQGDGGDIGSKENGALKLHGKLGFFQYEILDGIDYV